MFTLLKVVGERARSPTTFVMITNQKCQLYQLMFENFLLFEVRLAPLSYFSLFLTKDFRKFVIYNKALYITI